MRLANLNTLCLHIFLSGQTVSQKPGRTQKRGGGEGVFQASPVMIYLGIAVCWGSIVPPAFCTAKCQGRDCWLLSTTASINSQKYTFHIWPSRTSYAVSVLPTFFQFFFKLKKEKRLICPSRAPLSGLLMLPDDLKLCRDTYLLPEQSKPSGHIYFPFIGYLHNLLTPYSSLSPLCAAQSSTEREMKGLICQIKSSKIQSCC